MQGDRIAICRQELVAALEQLPEFVWRQADSLVAHGQVHCSLLVAHSDIDGRARTRVLGRIRQQVGDNPFEQRPVPDTGRDHVGRDVDTAPSHRLGPEALECCAHDLLQICRFGVQLNTAERHASRRAQRAQHC